MDKVLIVVDMQNDFINGELGSLEARKACNNAINKIKNWDGKNIICTFDTHFQDHYTITEEGRQVPLHCLYNTHGWDLHEFIYQALVKYLFNGENHNILTIEKDTFGSVYELPTQIEEICPKYPFEIHIIGLCTDICVISNALILRSTFPQARIVVDANCCAGSTKESHRAALEVMKANCIKVIGE